MQGAREAERGCRGGGAKKGGGLDRETSSGVAGKNRDSIGTLRGAGDSRRPTGDRGKLKEMGRLGNNRRSDPGGSRF